jgi:hypothetical protein
MSYIKHPVNGYEVLVPWSDELDGIYDAVKNRSLLARDRIYYLVRFLQATRDIDGCVAECGVYKGGSAFIIFSIMRKMGSVKKLYLYRYILRLFRDKSIYVKLS